MSGVTKELDILKQLFENLSDTDKQAFLTSVSQKEAVQVKKTASQRPFAACSISCLVTYFLDIITPFAAKKAKKCLPPQIIGRAGGNPAGSKKPEQGGKKYLAVWQAEITVFVQPHFTPIGEPAADMV